MGLVQNKMFEECYRIRYKNGVGVKNKGDYGVMAGQRSLLRKMRQFTAAKSGENGTIWMKME